jgi:hypothetical protein
MDSIIGWFEAGKAFTLQRNAFLIARVQSIRRMRNASSPFLLPSKSCTTP